MVHSFEALKFEMQSLMQSRHIRGLKTTFERLPAEGRYRARIHCKETGQEWIVIPPPEKS